MAAATHRVIGVLEWPARIDLPLDVLETLKCHVLPANRDAPRRIVSVRLPRCDRGESEMLTADIGQLGSDLRGLFDSFVTQTESRP